jgi:hypothetical protein
MYAPLSTGLPVPPNPLSSLGTSIEEPPPCEWAGWEEGDEAEDEEMVEHEATDPQPRTHRVGPGGRRCIVAATCSSGAHLRFSGSNMLERSYSPLQWQQHARAELISASVAATCSSGVTLRFRCSQSQRQRLSATIQVS